MLILKKTIIICRYYKIIMYLCNHNFEVETYYTKTLNKTKDYGICNW